jgi:hypothetical protein
MGRCLWGDFFFLVCRLFEGKGARSDGGHHSAEQHLRHFVPAFDNALLLHAGITMLSLDGHDVLVQG